MHSRQEAVPVIPPAPLPRSFSVGARGLNSAFQISSTRDAQVSFGVNIRIQSLLVGAAEGAITLRYADDSGFTTNIVIVQVSTNRTSGVLNLDNTDTATVTGIVPAAKYCRVDSSVIAGTATFLNPQSGTANQAYGQEVLL